MSDCTQKPLLSVKDLKVYYPVKIKNRGFFTQKRYVKAVDGISFDVYEGETFGVVGESGCGKSTIGKTIVRLNHPTEGNVYYEGNDMFQMEGRDNRRLCQEIQMIFQDPYSSLDPRFTVGRTIAEPLVVHKIGDKESREERVRKLVKEVGLQDEMYYRYPHEFSGGQRQRVGIARALALQPRLLVCDEPVSALDVSIQAQILNMMRSLQKDHKLTYIFISHNLSVVEHICDRIMVMYLGHLVELAETKELFQNPLHPYTKALIQAVPVPDPEMKTRDEPLKGDVPNPMNPPDGCPFCTRCPYADDVCRKEKPVGKTLSNGHYICCHKV